MMFSATFTYDPIRVGIVSQRTVEAYKPAYGLVECVHFWKLTVEIWMREDFRLKEVPGLGQLFVLQNYDATPQLIMSKVVDECLLAGSPQKITRLHTAIS